MRVDLGGRRIIKKQLREDIYTERRLELATEGHRFFDLIRTGKASEVLGDQGFVSSTHTYLPIPQQEIDAAPDVLTQNPGY